MRRPQLQMLSDNDYLFLFKTDSILHNALSDNSNFSKGPGRRKMQITSIALHQSINNLPHHYGPSFPQWRGDVYFTQLF